MPEVRRGGRRIQRLSARFVATVAAPGYHLDGDGLYLQVSPARTKSWIFRYQLAGRAREMGLGPEHVISLAEARARALAARRLLVDGIDPIEHRDALRAQERLQKANALSFATCSEKYIAAHRTAWRNPKHASQWTATIETYAAPVIGALPVQDVETAHLVRILEPLWSTKHETATRLRARIEHILDWARVQKYRTGDNPARLRGHLDKLLPKVKRRGRVRHHAALPYQEIGPFIEQLRAQEGIAARALEFCILTAARTGEVLNAKPEEFDLEERTWTIPADRMKAGKEHRVPLAPRVLELVGKSGGPYVFPGAAKGAPLSNMAMLELLKRMGREDLTVHGFRSTFRDWVAEETNAANIVAEMALAHTVGSDVEAAYRRGELFEKRRKLMTAWATYCDTPKRDAKVMPMQRRRKV